MIGWFLIAAIAAAVPIPFIKQWTETGAYYWIGLSALSYAVLIYAYMMILRHNDIAIVYPILKVLSVLIVVCAGLLLFSSKLDLQTAIGILLGATSIYLLAKA